ncbi:MAG: MFS transporter [Pseudomonadota bacterium]
MKDAFDALDEEITEGARSPISGVTSALGAGEALSAAEKKRVIAELPAYLYVQIAWFMAFGLQMVVFPYLLKNVLGVSGTLLGVAQMALSLPSVVFILLGGVVAERTDGRKLLLIFHTLAALPAFALSFALRVDALSYWLMIIYALAMGTIGAFMMPARDAILNEIVARRAAMGSKLTLQQGVAFATIAQFAAQIAGLTLGGMATRLGAWPLLSLQAVIVASGAIAAIWLVKGEMASSRRGGFGAVWSDMKDGLSTVRRNPILLSMVASMFGVGVFVIGAFLVLLPIVNADVYNKDSSGLRNIFVTFWAGAFVSSVAISWFKNLERQGRLLLMAQFIGSMCILVLVEEVPYHTFLCLVFIWGLASGVSITMSRSIVQSAAPPDKLARVLSIYQLGFMGGAPLGAALMGVVVDQTGPQLVALVPAIGMIALIIFMVVATPIWTLSAPKKAADTASD